MKMNELTPEIKLLLHVSKNAHNIGYIIDTNSELISECNPDIFYQLAIQNGLFSVAYRKLKHIKSFNSPKDMAINIVQKVNTEEKLSILNDIFSDCTHKNVCVGKGFSYAQYIYNDLYYRSFSDIDIYIFDTNISSFCKHLLKKGCEFVLTEGVDELHGSGIDYEATFQMWKEKIFYKNGQAIEVKTLSWDLSYTADLIEDADKVIRDYIHDSNIPLMSDTLNIIYLIINTYRSNLEIWGMCTQSKLRDFTDFYSFLKSCNATIKLNEVTRKYGLQTLCSEILICLYELYEDESIFSGIDFLDSSVSLNGIFPKGNSIFCMIEGSNSLLEKYLHNSYSSEFYTQEGPAIDELLMLNLKMKANEYIYSAMNSRIKFLGHSNHIEFVLIESSTRVIYLFKRPIDFMDLSLTIEIRILKCFSEQILTDNYRTIRLSLTLNDFITSSTFIDDIQVDMYIVNDEQIFYASFLSSDIEIVRTKDSIRCVEFYIEIFPEDLKAKVDPWFYLGNDFAPLRYILQDFSGKYVWNNVEHLDKNMI